MKQIVIDALQQRDLLHLYSDKQYNAYLNKINKEMTGNNPYIKALNIFDMFILNNG